MPTFRACVAIAGLSSVAGHGWITTPVSKNELAHHHWVNGMPDPTGSFRYEPQSCNFGNGLGQMLETGGSACGAKDVGYTKGLHVWQAFYDHAKVPVPTITPGGTIETAATLTIDHGGQAWLMLACEADIADEDHWTMLDRAPDDRGHHYMPSTPGAFAWAPLEYGSKTVTASWIVPANFTCPTSSVVGRWLWKTSNSCNDYNNIARKTQKYSHAEYLKVVQEHNPQTHWVNPACTSPPETFISCFDFELTPNASLAAPPAPRAAAAAAAPAADKAALAVAAVQEAQEEASALRHAEVMSPATVSACHDAAKAFCTNGHNFCRACQAWGSWGNMFFSAVCNDEPTVCHQNIVAADGTVCACQQKGGCHVDGVLCAGPNATQTQKLVESLEAA